MADAKKCDRCGGYYEMRAPTPVESLACTFSGLLSNGLSEKMESFVDLCPACSKSLKKWANAKGAGDV